MLTRLILKSALLGLAIALSACSEQKFGLPSQSVETVQTVTYNNKVDILFIMDNSTSMLQHQENVAKQVDPLLDELLSKNLDIHIGVTTTDMGAGGQQGAMQGTPAYMTAQTPNLKQELRNRLVQGDLGSNLERGLEAVQSAFSGSNLTGPNSGFLREEAFLMIIVVADEEDHSSNTSQTYIDFLNSVKPPDSDGGKNWILNFIGVLEPSTTCTTFNSFYSIGFRYLDLVNYSSGIKETICTADFKNAISNIRQKILSRLTDYPLKNGAPDVASIEVFVDGEKVENDPNNGWTYLPEKNVVRFNGASIPKDNAKVVINYQPTEAS